MSGSSALGSVGGILLAVCVLASLPGCSKSDGPERHTLEGAVTVNGQPVRDGSIFFSPDSSQGNSGPGAVAMIRNGRYETPSGHGIVGGPHIVEIMGYDEDFDPSQDDEPPVSINKKLEVKLPEKGGTHDFDF